MADTLLVDKGSGYQDIQSAQRTIVLPWDGLFDSPVKRGANLVIPYAQGEIRTDKKISAREFFVPLLVVGASTLANLHSELATLTGILPDLTGDSTACTLKLQRAGQSDVTAAAEYLGFTGAQVSYRAARLTVDFRLLTGAFA